MMNIDILIPTYNRSHYLLKNLSRLKEIITSFDQEDVNFEILISDNASTENDVNTIRNYIQDNQGIKINLWEQKENIGFCNNLLFLFSNSKGDYIITLGDDDYLDRTYIDTAIKEIRKDPNISCILPSFEAISESGERLGYGRDLGQQTKAYEPGLENAKHNTPRAHQISGIILKRQGLYEAILEHRITNLYPQIFMVAYACLNGKCLHLPEWPVLVTQTSKKAWSYDDMGLLNEIFENFKALNIKDSDRFGLESWMVKTQRWRALRYWKSPFRQIKVIFNISNGTNTSRKGHFLFPLILSFYWSKFILQAVAIKVKNAIN